MHIISEIWRITKNKKKKKSYGKEQNNCYYDVTLGKAWTQIFFISQVC